MLAIAFFFHFLIVVQVQLSPFFSHHSPCPTHPHLPPSILPPFGFVHMSFIHISWRSSPCFQMPFKVMKKFPSILSLLRVVVRNRCLIFWNAFPASNKMRFLILLNFIHWCSNAKLILYSWNDPTWSWFDFLKIWYQFLSMFMRGIEVLFLIIFYWFWYQGHDSFMEWCGKYSFLWMLLEEFVWNRYAFHTSLVGFSSESVGFGFFFTGKFIYKFSFLTR